MNQGGSIVTSDLSNCNINTTNRTLESLLNDNHHEILSSNINGTSTTTTTATPTTISSPLNTANIMSANNPNTNNATFSSSTPYIIQNGKIYQLTANNQLIARNLIHINQLSNLVQTSEQQSNEDNTNPNQSNQTNNNGTINVMSQQQQQHTNINNTSTMNFANSTNAFRIMSG